MSNSTWDPGLAGGENSPPSAAERQSSLPESPNSRSMVQEFSNNPHGNSPQAQAVYERLFGERAVAEALPFRDPTEAAPVGETQAAVESESGESLEVADTSEQTAPTEANPWQTVALEAIRALQGQAPQTQAQTQAPVQSAIPEVQAAQTAQTTLSRFQLEPAFRAEMVDFLNAQRGVGPENPAYLDVNNRAHLENLEARLMTEAKFAAQEAKLAQLQASHEQQLQQVRLEAVGQQADALFEATLGRYQGVPTDVRAELATQVANKVAEGKSPKLAIQEVFSNKLTLGYLNSLRRPGTAPQKPKAVPSRHQKTEELLAIPDRSNGRQRQMSPREAIARMERGQWDLE